MDKEANFHVYIKMINSNRTKEIPITSVEISEEDLRVKSAKFSTYLEIDLSAEMYWVNINYWGQLIYSGMILSMEYDETNGIYSYQSLGHQRWLTSKTWFVHNPNDKSKNLYDAIKEMVKKVRNDTSINKVSLLDKNEYEMYYNISNIYKSYYNNNKNKKTKSKKTDATDKTKSYLKKKYGLEDYGWEIKDGLFYEDKTYYEIIQSLVSKSLYAIDCYVDEYNTLRFDKINLNEWTNPNNVKLTTRDLTGYTYKSDATDIVTGVIIKETDIYKQHKITEPKYYSSKSMIGEDLTLIYGKMDAFEQSETKTTSTESTSSESTSTESNNTESNNTESTSNENTNTEKEVADVIGNERKARAKITTQLRDLMSFEIELNGYYPQIHTNMFIWFEVPQKHTLANYSKFMAKIDQTTTRGGSYVLNRFYVENISTTYDENGISSKITLNPFASDMSSYYKIYEDAIKSYEQANCSGSSSSSNSTGGVASGSSSGQKYAVGIDYGSGHNDSSIINNICNGLKQAGATVENLGIGPGRVQNFGLKSASKGYTGIFIVNGVGLGTPSDIYLGITKGYYHYTDCIFVFPQWIGNNFMSNENLKNRVVKASAESDVGFISGGSTTVEKWFNSHNHMAFVADTTPQNIVNKIVNQDFSISGSSENSNGSGSCNNSSSTNGSYSVAQSVSDLANKLTSATEEIQVCKDLQKGTHSSIKYTRYCSFCREPEKVISTGSANCGDGTRLQLTMCAYKGVTQSKLICRHISGHYYACYGDTAMDWCGGGIWGHHYGSGGYIKHTVFPKFPTQDGCYACGDEILEIINDLYDWEYYYNTLKEIEMGLPNSNLLNNFNYLDYNKFKELGYKSHNQYINEYFINDIEDIEFEDLK